MPNSEAQKMCRILSRPESLIGIAGIRSFPPFSETSVDNHSFSRREIPYLRQAICMGIEICICRLFVIQGPYPLPVEGFPVFTAGTAFVDI